MRFDTVIVAGGRSSRLDGTAKARLRRGGTSLVELTVRTVHHAGTVVVVGPEDLELPPHTLHTREDPPFSGPAAAVAAGLHTLAGQPVREGWTAVLACDMPDVAPAVDALTAAAEHLPAERHGTVAVTARGRRENLAVLVRTEALNRVFADRPTQDRSVRSFWKHLEWCEVPVPEGSTQDVDTWEDVTRFDLH